MSSKSPPQDMRPNMYSMQAQDTRPSTPQESLRAQGLSAKARMHVTKASTGTDCRRNI